MQQVEFTNLPPLTCTCVQTSTLVLQAYHLFLSDRGLQWLTGTHQERELCLKYDKYYMTALVSISLNVHQFLKIVFS